jgi:hypothetical protein
MANYLVPSAKTLNLGTDGNDTFTLRTALQVSVEGRAGNDLVTASLADTTNYTLASLGTGAGNDTVTFSGGTGNNASITLGAGNDFVSADAFTFTSTLFQGGGGNDTIVLSAATLSNATIAGNAGNDRITADSLTVITTSQILLGGGKDTLSFSGSMTAATVQGGGGSDLISANFVATTNGTQILGDEIGSEFYGNDTIAVSSVGGITAGLIQGAGGADRISASNFLGSAATINGNFGKDSIVLSAAASDVSALIAGGAGGDTISFVGLLSGQTNIGTIKGGGGTDLITVTNVGVLDVLGNGSAIFVDGGAGADTILIDIGNDTGRSITGETVVKYGAATESNLANTDTISAFSAAAGSTLNSGSFTISQSIVSATLLTDDVAGQFLTDVGGIITWTGSQSDITARVDYLDTVVSQGKAGVLTDVGGTSYLFVQGGATGGGNADDLIVQLGQGVTGLSVVGGTALTVKFD